MSRWRDKSKSMAVSSTELEQAASATQFFVDSLEGDVDGDRHPAMAAHPYRPRDLRWVHRASCRQCETEQDAEFPIRQTDVQAANARAAGQDADRQRTTLDQGYPIVLPQSGDQRRDAFRRLGRGDSTRKPVVDSGSQQSGMVRELPIALSHIDDPESALLPKDADLTNERERATVSHGRSHDRHIRQVRHE